MIQPPTNARYVRPLTDDFTSGVPKYVLVEFPKQNESDQIFQKINNYQTKLSLSPEPFNGKLPPLLPAPTLNFTSSNNNNFSNICNNSVNNSVNNNNIPLNNYNFNLSPNTFYILTPLTGNRDIHRDIETQTETLAIDENSSNIIAYHPKQNNDQQERLPGPESTIFKLLNIHKENNFNQDGVNNNNNQANIKLEETTTSTDNITESSDETVNRKGTREAIYLTEEAKDFRAEFYKIFGEKKRISKSIVRKAHNIICHSIDLPKMKREEYRSIQNYFNNYSSHSSLILKALHNLIMSNPLILSKA